MTFKSGTGVTFEMEDIEELVYDELDIEKELLELFGDEEAADPDDPPPQEVKKHILTKTNK